MQLIVIGVVLGALHVVVRVHIPLVVCDDTTLHRTLGLIALVAIVVFVVANFSKNLLYGDIRNAGDRCSDELRPFQRRRNEKTLSEKLKRVCPGGE